MKTKVTFPLSLSRLTGNTTELECQAETLEELLDNLNCRYPGIKKILLDEDGMINHSFIIFLNGKIVRSLENEEILLNDGDEIQIIQLVAGG